MNKNNNLKTAVLIVSTIVLALVAIGTAFWLYQLQSQPVAPNVPESKPKATAPSQANCTGSVSFTLTAAANTDSPATPTSTPTPTPTRAIGGPAPTATPTPTSRPTTTTAPTTTPTPASSPTSSGSQTTPTPTSVATTETLPNVGVSWPVLAGISAGALVLFIGILLAL